VARKRPKRRAGGGSRAQKALGTLPLGSPGRPVPTTNDVSNSFSPPLPSDVAPTELVAVEHLLGPALLDLLKHRDRDSLFPTIDEIRNAET
jgi:hypothetical protein